MKVLIILFLIFLIVDVSAIRISEVELNPEGQDTGNEWVELFCEDETDIGDFKLVNNDDNEINLDGDCYGYFIYVFEKQWLDNSDEKVLLYEKSHLIDETDLLNDDKNNGLTWSYCKGWKFLESTKKEENICFEEDEVDKKKSETSKLKENESEHKLTNNESFNKNIVQKPEVIKLYSLTEKDIKSKDDENLNTESYAIYGLIGFSILLAFLFGFKKIKDKKYKNEFK